MISQEIVRKDEWRRQSKFLKENPTFRLTARHSKEIAKDEKEELTKMAQTSLYFKSPTQTRIGGGTNTARSKNSKQTSPLRNIHGEEFNTRAESIKAKAEQN